MSECSIFVFAVIFPVLTHWFSTASPDAGILARKTLFQQQYLKTPLAFETAFFVRASVTAFIICLNTKRSEWSKHIGDWICVLLYTPGLKCWNLILIFKSVKIILVRFANAVLPNRTYWKNTCKTFKSDFTWTFDLLLPMSIFCYATRTFARLEIICITLIYE